MQWGPVFVIISGMGACFCHFLETGTDVKAADIILQGKTKHNNLLGRQLPNGKNAWTNSRAKQDKLMALTTQFQQLQHDLQVMMSSVPDLSLAFQ